MFTVIVAEDDLSLQRMMCDYLKMNGFTAHGAADGEKALDLMERIQPDLLIVDVMMPVMGGIELTREVRAAWPRLPVLMVTARDQLDDKREGFSAGADDYLTKPIDLDEMLLHINALLRRANVQSSHRLTVGQTELDAERLTLTRGEVTTELPKKEFFLLFKLLSDPGHIFTRRQLMDEIWGMDAESDERTVDVHIKRLREKCENIYPDFEIMTVRGLGYKAEKRNESEA